MLGDTFCFVCYLFVAPVPERFFEKGVFYGSSQASSCFEEPGGSFVPSERGAYQVAQRGWSPDAWGMAVVE